MMASDIEIARAATLRPIRQIADALGLPETAIEPHGHAIAKLSAATLAALNGRAAGKLILVTAVNPTPGGEGKTTTTIGLADALNRIGRKAVIALREPSLGPVFGRKGGATGGGQAQVLPMEKINLHFTGDFHAITSAHNLLAAMIDNAVHFGTPMPSGATINPRSITWKRVMDMNDRALRQIVSGLGTGNHPLRETGFDITVASEVMAIVCLADDVDDLQARLARIRVARDTAGNPVTAGDIGAAGAMAALLADAMQPNLVQTIHGSPALVHGGPFANIAHGCNSVIATRAALADASSDPHGRFTPLYATGTDVFDTLTIVATRIHRAAHVTLSPAAHKQLAALRHEGLASLPVCIAKTPYSFTADEKVRGAVFGHDLPIRELRLAAGAGFIVALTGEIATMPGLPRQPSANGIHLDAHGRIEGLS
jgi:formyltetrahydrofolate synthetase